MPSTANLPAAVADAARKLGLSYRGIQPSRTNPQHNFTMPARYGASDIYCPVQGLESENAAKLEGAYIQARNAHLAAASPLFRFPAKLPAFVGEGKDLEQVMIPLEVRAYWFDGAFYAHDARVTDFVFTETGFRVRNAGERYAIQDDELSSLERQAREHGAACAGEYEPDDQSAAFCDAYPALPFVVAAEEFDQRVREAA